MARDSRCCTLERYLWLAVLVAVAAADSEKCDTSKCNGPVRYYKDLGCKPVYEKEGDCCPVEFNCEHLKERARDKCYVNGKEYAIGDRLKKEDQNPCDLGCTCHEGPEKIAAFNCAIVDCFYGPRNPNCYFPNSPTRCCPGPEKCLAEGEERPTCEVDGKVYKDGEYFKPESDPELNCYCGPGYEGKNVEPFCKKFSRPPCAIDFRNPRAVLDKCAPVFYVGQNPATDCAVVTRCQTEDDEVIHTHDEFTSSEEAATRTCHFGDLELHHWDELKQIPGYDSECVKCVCDLPPYVTCKRLPDEECKPKRD